MTNQIHSLIIGAGPFGMALSAFARRCNIEHVIVGRPMEFWRSHMPSGMILRSACDWHLDPFDEHTIERFLELKKLKPMDVEPLTLDFYLEYCEWFRRQKDIEPGAASVRRLDYFADGTSHFEAELDDGSKINAHNVVLALGFGYFKNVPEPYASLFPAGRVVHTCDLVAFGPLRNKRVLIVGGRQSAFEWAALLMEAGAERVYLSYRHATPEFRAADWSWVNPLVDSIGTDPGWFRRLTDEEKGQVNRRLWAEGRLKLEPWLGDRIRRDGIKLMPESQVTGCEQLNDGSLDVTVGSDSVNVDQVVLATGYKVNVELVPLLTNGNIMPRLITRNGFPVLDEKFQSNLPGLYFTSMCATQDFGPFFAFTAAARTSAKIIGAALRA